MFIVKSQASIGWYARGFDHPDAIKSVNVPLTADTVFRAVAGSRRALRGHISQSPATAQAIARLGGDPQGFVAVPLILRDKVAAVLYCDTPQDEVPQATADLVEILVAFAGKVIDVLSAVPKAMGTAPGVGGTSPGMRAPMPAPAPAPAPPAAPPEPGGAATAMWGTGTMRPQPTPLKPPTLPPGRTPVPQFTPGPPPLAPRSTPPSAPPGRAIAPEDQKAHDDAKRFARLVVSEIKLYNESKVAEGRKTKDIYERLKEDIERGRQMYRDRVGAPVRDTTDYFHDELVRILAGGDASALGAM
jgi:hypothetical protein